MTPLQERKMLLTHGTRAFQLKPGSILQAAERDLEIKRRKAEYTEEAATPYAFCRRHVKKAKTVADLLANAIGDIERGLASNKYNTILIYSDADLLQKCLEIATSSGHLEAAE